MANALDLRFDFAEDAHLPRPGGELLWSIRAWVVGVCRDMPVEARIRDVFADIGAPDATDLLLGLLLVVRFGTLRTLKISCICDRRIGTDERLLLDVVALYQHDRCLEAMMRLRSFLAPRAALAARDSAERLASVLAASGYWLASPDEPAMHQTALVAEDARSSMAWPAMVH